MAKRVVQTQEELRAEWEANRARSLAEEAAMAVELEATIAAEMRGEFSGPIAGLGTDEEVEVEEVEAGNGERKTDLGAISFFKSFEW